MIMPERSATGMNATGETGPRASAILGLVQRDVGISEQVLEPARVVHHGDAQARVDRDQVSFELIRIVQRVAHPSRYRLGFRVARDVLEQHGELVASKACEELLAATRRFQTVGDLDQQIVADRMTHGVVDPLEAVQVDEHEADPRPAPASAGNRTSARLVERPPIGQPRQFVRGGLVTQAVLQEHPFGHFAGRDD
jgi:hypothetical protein